MIAPQLSNIIGRLDEDGQVTFYWKGVPEPYLNDQLNELQKQVAASAATAADLKRRMKNLRRQQQRKLRRQQQQLLQQYQQQLSELERKLEKSNRKSEAYRKRASRAGATVQEVSQHYDWAVEALDNADEMLTEDIEAEEESSGVIQRFVELTSRLATGTPGKLVLLAQRIFKHSKAPFGTIRIPINELSQELFDAEVKGLSKTAISENISNIDKINYFVQRCLCKNKRIGLMLDLSKVSQPVQNSASLPGYLVVSISPNDADTNFHFLL